LNVIAIFEPPFYVAWHHHCWAKKFVVSMRGALPFATGHAVKRWRDSIIGADQGDN
jgi:hypothetical protein